MTNNSLITEDQLKEWTKYARTGDVIRFLRDNKIPFWEGRGDSIVTTLEAINSRLLDEEVTPIGDVW
ncbi:MAG: hypothetical protein B0D91_05190 [Oceanospirillales bacterium LUC14_002_19_P2]|nr:MAG: hypothetical protein B0D91_05190 [Oceanospirillales bacterium LUC14_002_19_P2]